jgi:ADP-ribose pyrophosphatase YjhB (NUDIX family)
LIENKDALGYWYCLPGGGQNPGENLREAVVRECQEEIGVVVTVAEILFIRDYK